MPLQTPDYDAIRAAILRDIRSLLPEADIGPDSDNYVRAAGVSAAIEGIYQHQAWLYRQIWPDSADSDELERHAAVRGLQRKPAVAASGQLQVTGWAGTTVPAGTSVRHASGAMLVTTIDTPVGGDGTVDVRVVAVQPGRAANGLDGVATLTDPPVGVDSAAALVAPLAGGVDIESDADLLVRLLDLIRRPPAGGNQYDYRRWALEVAGVTAAYVYPLRRGLGTVDVVIVSADGLPGPQLLADVQAHIDQVRPVTAWDSQVFAPTLVPVDVQVQVALASGYTLADVQAAAEAQLTSAFAVMIPGETLYRSRVEAVVSGLPGVIDRVMVTPAANVVPVVDESTVEWVRLGVVTIEAMP